MEIISMLAGVWIAAANLFGFNDGLHEQPPMLQSNNEMSIESEEVVVPYVAREDYSNEYVTVYSDDSFRYIKATGLPNHETGEFPNSGNPNTISAQNVTYRVTLQPEYVGNQVFARTPGVALNGIPMVPGTAEREGEYNIEGLQNKYPLGMDDSNAHVQPTGAYHYHGVPEGYLKTVGITADVVQVGWAADGFAMYHDHSGTYRSGWELIEARSDGSAADGTYLQDFVFTNAGNLDECNGTWLKDTYAYFVTDEFPYIPRCLNGTPDSSFGGRADAARDGSVEIDGPPRANNLEETSMPTPANQAAPTEAVVACSESTSSASCSFTGGRGETVSGTCQSVANVLACVPTGGPPSTGGMIGTPPPAPRL